MLNRTNIAEKRNRDEIGVSTSGYRAVLPEHILMTKALRERNMAARKISQLTKLAERLSMEADAEKANYSGR